MKGVLVALAVSLSAVAQAAPEAARQARNARVFDRAVAIVGRRYWDRTMHDLDWAAESDRVRPQARDAPDDRALYAAINGLLGRLGDSHVYAVAPAPARHGPFRKAGAEEIGYGFAAYRAGAAWIVHRVVPGGPAAGAGIRIGWRLIAADGRPPDVDTHPREGDVTRLMLADETGHRHDVVLHGVMLSPEPSRRARRLTDGTLLLAFDQFSGGEDDWIAGELRRAPALSRVILDLRENEGGEADVLDRIAGMFVGGRQVILRLSARGVRDERTRGAVLWRGPLAVLVGPRTASAGEALAAFLDESGRAISLGERTAGALTAGVEHRLPDGGRLIVAQQDIRTAAGTRVEGAGFTPRHIVSPSLADMRSGRDPQLDRALALLRDQPGGGSISMSPPSVR